MPVTLPVNKEIRSSPTRKMGFASFKRHIITQAKWELYALISKDREFGK